MPFTALSAMMRTCPCAITVAGVLTLLLAPAVFVRCVTAARVAPDLVALRQGMLAQRGDSLLPHWLQQVATASSSNKDDEKKTAYVAFHYYIDPDQKRHFLEAWDELEKEASKEKDLIFFDLKQHMTTNNEFFGYGEWKSYKAYMDHFESKHVQSFIEKLMKHDVAFTIEPLDRPDVGELNPKKERETSKPQAHAFIRYYVPPSAHQAFLDAWNEAEKATEGEKGAHVYSLRKSWFDNTHFFAYATWETMDDFHAHFESDHVHKLRESLDKNHVVWHLAPLEKMGRQPE